VSMLSSSVAQAIDGARARHKHDSDAGQGRKESSRHHVSLGLQSAIDPEGEGGGGTGLTEVQAQAQYQQDYDNGASAFGASTAPAVAAAGGDNHITIYSPAAGSHPHPQPPRRTGALHGSLHAVCKRSLEKEASKSNKRTKIKKTNSATVLDAAAAAAADNNATAVLEVTSLMRDFATNVCNAGQQGFGQDSDEVIICLKQDRHGVFCPAATTVTRIPTFTPQNDNSSSSGKTASTSHCDHLWHTRFKELMLHKATYNTWTTKEKEHGTLHTWVKQQQLYYRSGLLSQEQRNQRGNPQTLSEEQYKCLKQVGFPFPSDTTFGLSHNNKMNSQFPTTAQSQSASHWDQQLAKFVAYTEKEGTSRVDPKAYPSLNRWVRVQRNHYLNRFKDSATESDREGGLKSPRRLVMTDERYHALCAAGFVFPDVAEEGGVASATATSTRTKQDRTKTQEAAWENQLARYIAYIKKYGTSMHINPQIDPKLNKWVRAQRCEYTNRFKERQYYSKHKNDEDVRARNRQVLTDLRYEKLCEVGFLFPDMTGEENAAAAAAGKKRRRRMTHEEPWDRHLAQYVAHKEKYGKWRVDCEVDETLKHWVRHQRNNYNNGLKVSAEEKKSGHLKGPVRRPVLSDQRYDKLCQAGFVFPDSASVEEDPSPEAAWERQLAKYVAHKEANGGTWRVGCETDATLKYWVKTQRYNFNNGLKVLAKEKKNGRFTDSVRRPVLSDQRYAKLCQAGFVFPDSASVEERFKDDHSPEAAWDRQLAKYAAHTETHGGTWRVDCETDKTLKYWVRTQRCNYYNGLKASAEEKFNGGLTGTVRRPVLSDQRYDKLCQAGFVFPASARIEERFKEDQPPESAWDRQLAKYVAHREMYGGTWRVDCETDKTLKYWVRTQRCNYYNGLKALAEEKNDGGLTGSARRPVLSDQRYEKLCQAGFVFPDSASVEERFKQDQSPEAAWDRQLAKYVAHNETNGGAWRVDCETDAALKYWVKTQRYNYNNGLKASAEEKINGRLKGSARRQVLSDQRYVKLCQAGFVFPDSASDNKEDPPPPSGNHKPKKKRRLAPSPEVESVSSPTGTGTRAPFISWETQLAAFIAYQETHGYIGQVSATGAPVLSKWVTNQRKHYVNRFGRNIHAPGDEDEDENDDGSKLTHARPVLSDQRYDQLCQAGFIFPDIGDEDDDE
jgi:hypothetical protein